MATKLQHTVTCPFGVTAYRDTISDRDYWTDLVAGIPVAPGEVTSVELGASAVAVALVQHIPADKLPAAVTSLVSGDLAIHRTMEWDFSAGHRARATFRANVAGAPADTEGTVDLRGDTTSCALEYSGKVTVRIPFLGGKIEKLIATHLVSLLDAERDYTVTRHQGRR